MDQFKPDSRPAAATNELLLHPRRPEQSLQQWLYEELRQAIIDKRLQDGDRLPSTRRMAEQWQLSRGTVVSAYEQLAAEGYTEARQGSGVYVAAPVPASYSNSDISKVNNRPPTRMCHQPLTMEASPFPVSGDFSPKAFRPFQPDCELFPFRNWTRLLSSLSRENHKGLLRYGDAAGYLPLRKEIAHYLARARGIRCSAEQLVIVSGTQYAMTLIGQLLLQEGDSVVLEDPSYSGTGTAFGRRGVKLIPLPVDADGMDVSQLPPAKGVAVKLVYVTPANQCPLGTAMSLERRFQLLEWARESGAYIFEDDYDGEFRYSGQPLPALQGLDRHDSVIYAGTFNKSMFVSLRLGYVVLPPALLDAFIHLRSQLDRFAPGPEQAALTTFLAEGHYARHIRRMRKIYAARLKALQEAASQHLNDIRIDTPASGLETIAWLPPGSNDQDIATHLQRGGIECHALSRYCLEQNLEPGLILGFGAIDEEQIRAGIRRMAGLLE